MIYGEIIAIGFEPEEGIWGYIIRNESNARRAAYPLYCTMPASRISTLEDLRSGDYIVSEVRFIALRYYQLYLDCIPVSR